MARKKQYTPEQTLAYYRQRINTGKDNETGEPLTAQQLNRAAKKVVELSGTTAVTAAPVGGKNNVSRKEGKEIKIVVKTNKNGSPYVRAYLDNE